MKTRLLWAFASLGGIVAWFLHLMIAYTLGEFLCVTEGSGFTLLGLSSARWSIALLTAILCGTSVAAAWVAWRLMGEAKKKGNTGTNRGVYFLLRVGLISDVFFVFGILYQAIPIFFLGGGC